MNKRKELIKELIKEFDLKDTNDISSMFRELMGDTIQEMLNSELDEELGYEKYNQSNKKTENSRNGFSEKSMRSELGDVTIKIPRDRKGEFEPQVVKKYQKDLGSIEHQIITLYAKGNRGIEDFIKKHVWRRGITFLGIKNYRSYTAGNQRMAKQTVKTLVCDGIHGCDTFSCAQGRKCSKQSGIYRYWH